jgi:hypothetical protein
VGSLIICYMSFCTINFPCFLPYSFPVTLDTSFNETIISTQNRHDFFLGHDLLHNLTFMECVNYSQSYCCGNLKLHNDGDKSLTKNFVYLCRTTQNIDIFSAVRQLLKLLYQWVFGSEV